MTKETAPIAAPWAALQTSIYSAGMQGDHPSLPTNLLRLEAMAMAQLDDEARNYIVASAGDGATARENRVGLERLLIRPRVLADVAHRSTACSVLGEQLAAPLLIAPVGVQTLAHPDGELATARAATRVGVPYVHSQASSFSYEEVAAAAPDGQRWSQFYWLTDEEVSISMLERAAAAGFTHLVLTVDTLVLGWRPADLDRAYLPFLRGIGMGNYRSDPAFLSRLAPALRFDPVAWGDEWLKIFPNPGLSWQQLSFLREHWHGPILLKGISTADDAARALDAGMDGLIVSNHGGRQVDGAVAAIDCLPEVVARVDDRCPVLFDSGIRTGIDIFRAVALGAAAALVGRPFLYGLALAGEAGVEHVLRVLLAEFDVTLALSGHRSHLEVGRDSVLSAR